MEAEKDIVIDLFPVRDEVDDDEFERLRVNPGVSEHRHIPVREPDMTLIDDSNRRARANRLAEEANT